MSKQNVSKQRSFHEENWIKKVQNVNDNYLLQDCTWEFMNTLLPVVTGPKYPDNEFNRSL